MTFSLFSKLALRIALTSSSVVFAADGTDKLTQPMRFGSSETWNQPQAPIKIYGDTYYVGVAGLSSILIHSDAGLILLDGGLPQSAPLIEANIRALGFKLKDIRFILNSHAHADHAGGIAALQRDSGAIVVASPSGAKALHDGHVVADDPQLGFVRAAAFPAVAQVREIHDGETLRVGGTAVTAHFTPGHTPGSTSWTWTSCENGKCLDVVYADSLNAVAAPGFHFLADKSHADLTERFRTSIDTVANLPCDILITVHPELADGPNKLKLLQAHTNPNPFIDSQACRTYAATASALLQARIAEEKSAAAP
jgi:metallo-beta-lactamase class B